MRNLLVLLLFYTLTTVAYAIPQHIERDGEAQLSKPAIIVVNSCRLVTERVICGQDCRNVRVPAGDGRTYVNQRQCNPRYCTRQRRVCN